MTEALLRLLAGPGDPDLAEVVRAFVEATAADGAILLVSDGETLSVGGAHPAKPAAEAALTLPVGFGVTGLVARNGHAVRLGSDSPRNPAHRQLLGLPEGGAVSRMCLPARGMDGQILGVVAVHRATYRPFADSDLTKYQPYADLVGLRLHARGLVDAVDAHRSDRDRLIAQAISAQESERRRIAFDLHDGVTTALASMAFHLNAADLSISVDDDGSGPAAQARAQIGTARMLADLAYTSTRAAITGLHSLVLGDLGLVAALESLAEASSAEVAVELLTDPQEQLHEVADHAAAALYRIAQEAITNAVRHAEADRVVVSLRRVGQTVLLGVSDDGVGFDVRQQYGDRSDERDDGTHPGHFGLSSIAERCALVGASLRIESMPGRGTTVLVELPVS